MKVTVFSPEGSPSRYLQCVRDGFAVSRRLAPGLRSSIQIAIVIAAGLAKLLANPQSAGAGEPGLAAGQSPASNPPGINIRISVDLAQTDVVVTDRAGHPVRDLEASDFQLFENGQLRPITNFSWVDVAPLAQKPQASARHSTSALPPASIPRGDDLRRAFVLMMDDAGTNAFDLQAAVPEVRRFVAEQIKANDLAAVTASRGGMGMYEQLTNDRNQLYAAIDRIGRRPAWLSCDYIPPYVSENNEKYFHYVPGDFINSTNFCEPADKNGVLRRAIEGLGRLPGRKAVVLFSHAFGISPANAALANRAGVTIYVLDPAGGEPIKTRVPGGVEGTARLAEETGGFHKLTAPGHIGEDLREVLDEMSGYYLLGYHPSRETSERAHQAPPQSIRVRVLREGLIVHARTTPPSYGEGAVKQAPQTREQYLQQALFSPFASGGLRVAIQPAYTPSAPDSKTGRRGVDLAMHMTLENGIEADIASLTLDTAVAVLRADGTTAVSGQSEVTISKITPEQAARYRMFGIRFSMRLEVKQPGEYQIRVAVRNPANGKSGSAYTFLKIPDFSQGRLALATPVLGRSGWNEFAAGEVVAFSCEILGSSAGKTEGEILLYNEEGPIGAPRSLIRKLDRGGSYLEGAMPVPAVLAAGEYAIRLITWDAGAGASKPTGNYWSTLRVLNRLATPR